MRAFDDRDVTASGSNRISKLASETLARGFVEEDGRVIRAKGVNDWGPWGERDHRVQEEILPR